MSKLCLLLALSLAGFQEPSSPPGDLEARTRQANLEAERERDRQQALKINQLAGNIHSPADALALVNAVADALPGLADSGWASLVVRQSVAHAEFLAVSDPSHGIPEQRIADVWNQYVRAIGAPVEAVVTANEIHYLRDSLYASGQMFWTRRHFENLWTVPGIYALAPDGRLADQCRAIETLRVLHEMYNLFESLKLARERAQQGILLSDALKKIPEGPIRASSARAEIRELANPVRSAEASYLQQHGPDSLDPLFLELFAELFPPPE